jgi:hypothetical protein
VIWHYHKQPRVYFDVVVQVADDKDFATNVKTVFNNDLDNSAGLGVGKDLHYIETNEGKLIDAKGVKARYVRLYSNGNASNDLNHYIEVEVYGKHCSHQPKLVPLEIKLPKPLFISEPRYRNVPNLEKPLGKPRPPFLVPAGTRNVALRKTVYSTDKAPVIGKIEKVTDGRKEGTQSDFVEFHPGLQSVTIDLGRRYAIYAILLWHNTRHLWVYYDVVVQVADDPDFAANVRTLFNNDGDNSAGLGEGKDKHYVETNEGKLIDAHGVKARYVRLYSDGNSANEYNHYTEVEVYANP